MGFEFKMYSGGLVPIPEGLSFQERLQFDVQLLKLLSVPNENIILAFKPEHRQEVKEILIGLGEG